MSDDRPRYLVRKQQLSVRVESLPVTQMPASTTGRDSTAAFFYMGMLSILPTVGFSVYYGIVPLAALLILPRAIYAACHLASRRYAAYEDTPPAQAAFVQSCLVWLGLLCSWPATIAFDVANTIIWQLVSGAFIAVVGPGVANQWFDLPRQIYVPVQPGPPAPQQQQPRVISGASIDDYDEVYAEQQAHMRNANNAAEQSYVYDDSWLDDEEQDS